MESFSDAAIILSQRTYLDKGYVISAFTRKHGRHAGFAYKSALSGIEIATLCDVQWEARISDQLGSFKHFDIDRTIAPLVIGDRLKLSLVQSVCSLCDIVLPEREPHPDLFEATSVFLSQIPALDDPLVAVASYIMWELLVLRTLGYGLDLSKCVSTETTENLVYVSPKTGKAVCTEAGEPYKEKLLKLPPFLRPDADFNVTVDDIKDGLFLTQTFFEKWVLTHMSAQLPDVRYNLAHLFKQGTVQTA